jgi:glutamate racemase
VVEVIRPAVRRAIAATRTGEVGVIGTSATIASGAYQDAFDVNPGVRVHAVACPSFVDFVERGITSGRQVIGLAQAYLGPLQRTNLDTLVLGCTHYPLLTGALSLVMGDQVTLVSSADETAGHRGPGAVHQAGPPVPRPGDRLRGRARRPGLTRVRSPHPAAN